MSDVKFNIGSSENSSIQNAEDNEIPLQEKPESKGIMLITNSLNTVGKQENLQTESINIKVTENDGTHDKKHDEVIHEKSISDIDIATYLRSEFSGINDLVDIKIYEDGKLEKLPPYGARIINMKGYKSANISKKSKGKIRNYKPNVMVQLFKVMAGENAPEDQVVMIYEPETRNFTVKGMFAILLVLHLSTFMLTMIIFFSPPRVVLAEMKGIYVFIVTMCMLIFLILAVACFQCMRLAGCITYNGYLALLLTSVAYGCLCCYFSTRLLMYMSLAMAFTDIVLIVLGCIDYDYTNKKLYAIAVGSGAGFLVFVVPLLNILGGYSKYWAKTRQDDPISYSLCFIITLGSIAIIIAELHLLLTGEWVELTENDYTLGAVLLYTSLFDYPIRLLRKFGVCNKCERQEEEEE